jgi:hypothetical protein
MAMPFLGCVSNWGIPKLLLQWDQGDSETHGVACPMCCWVYPLWKGHYQIHHLFTRFHSFHGLRRASWSWIWSFPPLLPVHPHYLSWAPLLVVQLLF